MIRRNKNGDVIKTKHKPMIDKKWKDDKFEGTYEKVFGYAIFNDIEDYNLRTYNRCNVLSNMIKDNKNKKIIKAYIESIGVEYNDVKFKNILKQVLTNK
jgi:hypothetical protein